MTRLVPRYRYDIATGPRWIRIAARLPIRMRPLLLGRSARNTLMDAEYFAQLERQWEGHWHHSAPHIFGERYHPPTMHQVLDCPDADHSTYRKLLFALGAGSTFADVAALGPRLASAVDRRIVIIEPFQEHPGTTHHVGFIVSHELEELGLDPHFNSKLDAETASFALRGAVLDAFHAMGWGTPLAITLRRLTRRYSPVVLWATEWIPRDGVTSQDVVGASDRIGKALRCDVSLAFTKGHQVMLAFGASAESGVEYAKHLIRPPREYDGSWIDSLSGSPTDKYRLRELLGW